MQNWPHCKKTLKTISMGSRKLFSHGDITFKIFTFFVKFPLILPIPWPDFEAIHLEFLASPHLWDPLDKFSTKSSDWGESKHSQSFPK